MTQRLLETGAAGPAVTAQITSGLSHLAGLEGAWNELFLRGVREPSASFEWTTALLRHHVSPCDRCSLIRLTRGNRLIGLVPIVVRTNRVFGQRVVQALPLAELSNTHSDLLLDETDPDVADAFVDALYALDEPWHYVRLSKLIDGSPLAVRLERSLRQRGARVRVQDGMPAYFLELPRSFEKYLSRRSAKFRNFLKRVERRIRATGTAHVIELSEADDLDAGLEALLRIERASWKHAHGTSIAATPRQIGFYSEMCRGAAIRGRLHLHVLMLGSTPAAYNLGYLTRDAYYYLKTSYDESFKHLSPATFLRARLVEGLIARGVRTLDFPGEPYDWERQWTDTIRWHKVLSIYSDRLKGRAIAALDLLRQRPTRRGVVEHVDARSYRPEAEATGR